MNLLTQASHCLLARLTFLWLQKNKAREKRDDARHSIKGQFGSGRIQQGYQGKVRLCQNKRMSKILAQSHNHYFGYITRCPIQLAFMYTSRLEKALKEEHQEK